MDIELEKFISSISCFDIFSLTVYVGFSVGFGNFFFCFLFPLYTSYSEKSI